jgi:hypothetical protein
MAGGRANEIDHASGALEGGQHGSASDPCPWCQAQGYYRIYRALGRSAVAAAALARRPASHPNSNTARMACPDAASDKRIVATGLSSYMGA